MDTAAILTFVSQEGPSFLVGGVLGHIVARFTLSKSDIKRIEQEAFTNANERRKAKEERYLAFTGALARYIQKKNSGIELTLDDFLSVSDAGALYFGELKMIADAILSGKIDGSTRDRTFVPDIHEAISKTLPAYYEELAKMAKALGVSYSGKFDQRNYQSLFEVAERFGTSRSTTTNSV